MCKLADVQKLNAFYAKMTHFSFGRRSWEEEETSMAKKEAKTVPE